MGREGKLPWRIPEDFENFSRLTAGQICVLGRVCFDTWPDAVRDGRQPVVLTHRPLPGSTTSSRSASEARDSGHSTPMIAPSFPAALDIAEALPGEIYVCGGQRVFEQALALKRPTRLHLTLVHAEVQGDRYFPEWRHLEWREVSRRDGSDATFRYTFFTLERIWRPGPPESAVTARS